MTFIGESDGNACRSIALDIIDVTLLAKPQSVPIGFPKKTGTVTQLSLRAENNLKHVAVGLVTSFIKSLHANRFLLGMDTTLQRGNHGFSIDQRFKRG